MVGAFTANNLSSQFLNLRARVRLRCGVARVFFLFIIFCFCSAHQGHTGRSWSPVRSIRWSSEGRRWVPGRGRSNALVSTGSNAVENSAYPAGCIFPSGTKGDVTLVNLQRQLAMIRYCAKNRSSVTSRCGRFLRYLQCCNTLKFLKAIQKCIMSANSCEKHALRIGVASWPV